jgi:hypothetical protein
LDYNLLFGRFVGLEMGDAVWDVTVLAKNRERPSDAIENEEKAQKPMQARKHKAKHPANDFFSRL